MKKGTKIGISIAATILGAVVLSSCTQSFCSKIDGARMMYAYDPGVTRFTEGGDTSLTNPLGSESTYTISNVKITYATWYQDAKGDSYLTFGDSKTDKLTYFNSIISSSISNVCG